MTEPLDLTECEREPIHIPGAIQPHGALLGLTGPRLEVVLHSANAEALLELDAAPLGRNVAELVGAAALDQLQDALSGEPRDVNPIAMQLTGGRPAHGIVHRSEGLLILEVEPAGFDELRFTFAYRRLIRHFDRLRRAGTVQDVCDIAAREVRELTQYDRVMVYRFDERANGQVISEARVDQGLEPYLGLYYPASDIPAQARRLYVENPLRIIVDAEYQPVPLVPALNPLSGRPLDLSHATLRSVSPVHCEYLRNMGVRGSMSISLLKGDELWGLVACHHRQPLHVPYGTRMVGEFLAHVLSARISELERSEILKRKSASWSVQAELIEQTVSAPRFGDGLTGSRRTLADLLDCDGAAVLYQGEVTRIAQAPPAEEVAALGAALREHARGRVIATDCLAELHPPAAAYAHRAAGAVAVPISAQGEDFIFWFRPERARTYTWAGDPHKPAAPADDGVRLGPRRSFAAWTERVRGRCEPWAEWEVEVAADFRTAVVAGIIHQAAELERLNRELVTAGRRRDRFVAAVSHELRNPLNAILGWVTLARRGLTPAELDEALEIIERNARAQTQLVDDLLEVNRIERGRLHLELEPIDLVRVVTESVSSMLPSARINGVKIETHTAEPKLNIVGDAGRLQQVVWNLLSNAVKFSEPQGCIRVRLTRDGSAALLEVQDDGAGIDAELLPHLFEPFYQGEGDLQRAGLGLGLAIVRSIVELHGGTVGAASHGPGQGAVLTVRLPMQNAAGDL